MTSDRGRDAYVPGLGLKVAHKRCDECLLSSAKIVDDDRRDQLLEGCRKDGTYFLCHKATLRNDAVVCRGFHETQGNIACRAADAWGLVVEVNSTTGDIVKPARLFDLRNGD